MPINLEGCYQEGGLIESWMKFCEPFEFPLSFGYFSLLAVASSAIEGRVLVNPNTQPSPFTNLYVVLFGPSGSRKGAAMEYARELLAQALPDSPMLPQSGTMQGIMDELAERSDALGRAPGMIYAEEFSDLIGGADYLERNSIFLTKLYDCRGEMTERTRMHKRITIRNPYVVILGASNPDWLEEINPKLLAGGFLRRIIIVNEDGPRQEAAAPSVNVQLFQTICDRFKERFAPEAFGGLLLPLDCEAQDLNREWYSRVVGGLRSKTLSGDEAHFVNTMQEHAIKLAGVIHFLDEKPSSTPILSAQALRCGQTLVERLTPGIFRAYQSLSGTPFAKLRSVAIRIARSAREPMTDAQLDRAVKADAGVEPEKAARAREDLLADGILLRTEDRRIIARR